MNHKIVNFIIFLGGLILLPQLVNAVGFEISPARYERVVEKGQVIESEITIINKGVEVTGELSVNDFTFKDDSGTPLIIESDDEVANSFALSKWITVPDEVVLIPGKAVKIPFKINVPENATPGGHYGTIFIQQKVEAGPSARVSTVTKVGALIILKVRGNIEEKMDISDFQITNTENKNLLLITNLKNDGNVHLYPQGKFYIKNEQGEIVQNIAQDLVMNDKGLVVDKKNVDYISFNEEGLLVLPGQDRKYETKFDTSFLQNGKYTIFLEINYGEDDLQQLLSNEIGFEFLKSEENVKISSLEEGDVLINNYLIYYIVGGVSLIAILLIMGIFILKKRKK